MPTETNSANATLPRRILGRLLREKREAAGVSSEAAQKAIGVSKQTFWRMETGQPVRINPLFISHLAQMYRLDEETTDVFLTLTEETHGKAWWNAFGDDIPRDFDLFLGLQDAAKRWSSYHVSLLPGLLQTREYRREITWTKFPGMPSEEVNRWLDLHAKQWERLYNKKNPLTLDVLLDESLLRRVIGSSRIMAEQLEHLIEVTEQTNVSIQVVPFDSRRHRGILSGQFVLLEFPRHPTARLTEPPVVYLEQFTGGLYLEKPEEVKQYRDVYADVQRSALDPDKSRKLIREVASQLSGQ